jgi:hypothetical protein
VFAAIPAAILVSPYLWVAVCALVGFLGGLAKELYEAKGDFQTRQVGMAFANGFTALVAAALMLAYGPEVRMLQLAVSAIAGWAGPWVLDYLTQVAKDKFTKKLDQDPGTGK